MLILLSESRGLDRLNEPVSVTLSFDPEELVDVAKLSVRDESGVEAPVQVTDLFDVPSAGHKTRAARHCTIHFLADLPAHGTKEYQILTSGQVADHRSDFLIKGGGLSLTVENDHLGVVFDPASGRVLSLSDKSSGTILETQNNSHWSPDCYEPERGWSHPFDWSPSSKVCFENGPVFFEVCRTGTFSEYPEISLKLVCRVYAGAPYLWLQSLISVDEDVSLTCLCNDAMAFKETTFTHLAWKESSGQAHSRALADLESINKDGDVLKLAPGTPWLGFINSDSGYGIASLRLNSLNLNRFSKPARLRGHCSYMVKSNRSGEVSWLRPLVYWPRHQARDQMLTVEAGTLYSEENVYCLASAAKDDPDRAETIFAQFDDVQARLKHPIFIEVEDESSAKIRMGQ